MPQTPLTKKPGEFRATCRMVEQLTAQEMTPEEHATATAAGATSRWDRDRKAEVWPVQCDFEFTDRDEFAQHMVQRHDGGRYRWENGSLDRGRVGQVRTYRPRMPIPVQPWKPPRLRLEGLPLRTAAEVKAFTKEPVLACRGGCGFVVEDRGFVAEVLERHRAECAAWQAAAS